MGKTCCFNCVDRHFRCHSSCEKWLEHELSKDYKKTTKESGWRNLSMIGFPDYEANKKGDVRSCYNFDILKRHTDYRWNARNEYYQLRSNGSPKRVLLKTIIEALSG